MKEIGVNKYVVVLKHDSMNFYVVKDAFYNEEDYIGYFINRFGDRQRVLRNSVYGELVSDVLGRLKK